MKQYNTPIMVVFLIIIIAFITLSNSKNNIGDAPRSNMLGVPVLLTPSDNANTVNPVSFTWRSIKYATSYEIEIADDSMFNIILIDYKTSSTLYTYNGKFNDGTYFWRIRSLKRTEVSAWSETRTFNVININLSQTSKFSDDFTIYTGQCLNDGAIFGQWRVVFNGYGCVNVESDGVNKWLHQSPRISNTSETTSASLVVGPTFTQPYTFTVDATTVQQLRQPYPNPWETAWILWDYTDNTHFYYFMLKTNGWELGKEDPTYPGSQRFLATGSSPAALIGSKYTFKIYQNANTMSIYVNNMLITTFTDTENPYYSGRIGLYNEDAHVHFDNVKVE